MPPEVRIEHRYPEVREFLREHGPQALAVLQELLARADDRDGRFVAQASTRDIADHLQFLSKDTVHRRLRQLALAGVIELIDRQSGSTFAPSSYVLHLEGSGISVLRDDVPGLLAQSMTLLPANRLPAHHAPASRHQAQRRRRLSSKSQPALFDLPPSTRR